MPAGLKRKNALLAILAIFHTNLLNRAKTIDGKRAIGCTLLLLYLETPGRICCLVHK